MINNWTEKKLTEITYKQLTTKYKRIALGNKINNISSSCGKL